MSKYLVKVLLFLLAVPDVVTTTLDRLSDRCLILTVVCLGALPAIGGSLISHQWFEALVFSILGGGMLLVVYVALEDVALVPAPARSQRPR